MRIVAVTKGHPLDMVAAAVEAGLHDLGETVSKSWTVSTRPFPDGDVRWHMIGHVQRRKAGRAARLASLVHSVDSVRLAEKLSRIGVADGRRVPVLVQVNASGEAAKGGFPAADALDGIAAVAGLAGLRVHGPHDDGAIHRRRSRAEVYLPAHPRADGGRRRHPRCRGRELSMGMSNDYAVAVEEGSTMVRLGTTLFGERPG